MLIELLVDLLAAIRIYTIKSSVRNIEINTVVKIKYRLLAVGVDCLTTWAVANSNHQ